MAWTALKAAIAAVIKTNGNQEITGAVLQSTLNTIVSNLGENATFKEIATPTTVPGTPDGTLFYIAYEKGIYVNFNAIDITDDDGLVILLYSENWYKINIPLATKNDLVQVRSDLSELEKKQIQGDVYDVSSRNDGAVFESLSSLLGSANLSTLIPTSVRRGGMSIMFIGSLPNSDNKYVQYRYIGTATTGTPNPFMNEANWQGVDDELTAGSDNLVKSGVVADAIGDFNVSTNLISNEWITIFDKVSINNSDKFVLNIELTNDVERLIIGYNNIASKRLYDKRYPNKYIVIEEIAIEEITSLQVYATLSLESVIHCNLKTNISYNLQEQSKELASNSAKIEVLNYVEDDIVIQNEEHLENGIYATDGIIDSPSNTAYTHAKVEIPNGTETIRLYNFTVFGTGQIEILFFKDAQFLSSINGTPGFYDYKEIINIPENATHFGYNRRSSSTNTHSECLIGRETPSLQKSFYAIPSDLEEVNSEGLISQEAISYFNNCRITSYGSGSDQVVSYSGLSVTVFVVQKDVLYEVSAVGSGDTKRWAALASNLITQAGALSIIEKYDGDSSESVIRITPSQTGYLYVENYKDVYSDSYMFDLAQ